MAKKHMSFLDLVNAVRKHGIKPDQQPRTYVQMAKRCGVSRPYFYAIIAGKKTPSDHFKTRIAKGLGVTVDDLDTVLAVSRRRSKAS